MTGPGATYTYLCSETVVPVASPTFMKRHGDASLTSFLLHIESRPMLWAEWLAAYGEGAEDAFRGHRFDQFTLLIEAAMAGLGAPWCRHT